MQGVLNRSRPTRVGRRVAFHAILVLASLAVLLPLVWVVLTSLKTPAQVISESAVSLPSPIEFANYPYAWTTARLGLRIGNSFFICGVSVTALIVFGSMAGYAFGRFDLKLGRALQMFVVAGMMIPLGAGIIPLFTNLRSVGLIDTYWGVILPYVGFHIPIAVFLISGFMRELPHELDEAATIDGAGLRTRFLRITLPLSTPVLATTAIVVFMQLWNEFLFALVFLNSPSRKTLPLGIMEFKGQYTINIGAMMAAVVIAIIPTITIYVLLRDRIVRGMTVGAVKS